MRLMKKRHFKADNDYLKLHKKGLCVRWGQTLWNTAEDYIKQNGSPKLVDCLNKIRGGVYDCFYDDEKTSSFYEQLKKLGK